MIEGLKPKQLSPAVAEIADRTFRLFRHLRCTTKYERYSYIDRCLDPNSDDQPAEHGYSRRGNFWGGELDEIK